jgi:DNA-binding CsgD family transcriptional regulator
MAAPSGRLRGLSDGLAELYAPDSIEDYPGRVITAMSRLVGADSCSCNHIDGYRLLTWRIEPADITDFPDSARIFRQHLPEHPVLAYHQASGDSHARRISDLLSDRQFRSLGLYRDFYRHMEVHYQLAVIVPAPGGGLIGVALNRQSRDFSADELELLDVLGTHIGQAAAIADLVNRPLPPLPADPDGRPLLTPRQTRILELVAGGRPDRNVARALGISTRTVHTHLQHIYRALDVTSRTEALARIRTLSVPAGTPGSQGT